MAHSQNGYLVLETASSTKLWDIPGVAAIKFARGAPGFCMAHLVLWFHEEVSRINEVSWDDHGWSLRRIGGTSEWSNHASGTAADLNALEHPQGVRGTFTDAQEAKIRSYLDFVDDAIRWGGDYQSTVDEMHFEVNVEREEIRALAARLKTTPRGVRILRRNT